MTIRKLRRGWKARREARAEAARRRRRQRVLAAREYALTKAAERQVLACFRAVDEEVLWQRWRRCHAEQREIGA